MLSEVLVVWLVEVLKIKYTVILVTHLVKELNQKMGVKLSQ